MTTTINKCCICSGHLNQPATLEPCQHRVCKRCLFNGLIRFNNRNCPDCRQAFVRASVVRVSEVGENEKQLKWSLSGAASAVGSLLGKRQPNTRRTTGLFIPTFEQLYSNKRSTRDRLRHDPWWCGHIGQWPYLVWRTLGMWFLMGVCAWFLHLSIRSTRQELSQFIQSLYHK